MRIHCGSSAFHSDLTEHQRRLARSTYRSCRGRGRSRFEARTEVLALIALFKSDLVDRPAHRHETTAVLS